MSRSAVEIANQMLLVIDEYKKVPLKLEKTITSVGQTFTPHQKSFVISNMNDALIGKLEGMTVALAIVCEEGE